MRASDWSVHRRSFLAATVLTTVLPLPPPAYAGSDAGLLSTLPAGSRARSIFETAARPKVKQIPRSRLVQEFAVLLMRSSYAVADELDFMPMDEFQKEQFLFRQSEWDGYRSQIKVTQGELTDPAYFDFISFCQYASIAQGMRNGRLLFEELIDAEGTKQVVRRNSSSPQANSALPEAHAARVGDRILDWIAEKAPNLSPKTPSGAGMPSSASIRAAVTSLDTVFEINEYMLTSTLTPLPAANGNEGLAWTLVAPATLWSGQVLQLRGDLPNSFEAMAVLAYLRRCGVPASCTTRYEKGTQVTHEFRWPTRFVSA